MGVSDIAFLEKSPVYCRRYSRVVSMTQKREFDWNKRVLTRDEHVNMTLIDGRRVYLTKHPVTWRAEGDCCCPLSTDTVTYNTLLYSAVGHWTFCCMAHKTYKLCMQITENTLNIKFWYCICSKSLNKDKLKLSIE